MVEGEIGPEWQYGSRRGVETLFRVAFRTTMEFRELADRKASILIQTNGLILSVVVVVGGVLRESIMQAPSITLLVFSLTSMMFALAAIYPQVFGNPNASAGTIERDEDSILFFSTMEQLDYEEYEKLMHGVLTNRARVYRHMIRQLHSAGRGSNYQFSMIKKAFWTLVVGVVVSVSLFGLLST